MIPSPFFVKPSTDPTYPGIYVGIENLANSDPLVLVERLPVGDPDAPRGGYAIRIWHVSNPQDDPIYVQIIKDENK